MTALTACAQCRTAVPPAQPTCLRCGHPVGEAATTCPACDRRSPENARFCAHCGQSLASPAEPIDAPPITPADPTGVFVDRVSRPLPWLIGLAVFAALALLVGVVKIVDLTVFQPGHTVATFFDALRDRDAAAARGALLSTGGGGDQTLLQGAVLRSPGYTPPTGVRIEKASVRDGQASVRVSLSLGGQRHTLVLNLLRDDRATAGLFHGWHLVDGLYPVAISAAGLDSVLVSGAPVRLVGDASGTGDATTLAAFPGGYRVTLPDQPLWDSAPAVAYAGATDTQGDTATVTLQPTVKNSALTTIDQRVRSYLDDCARSSTLAPDNCPFSTYSYTDVSDVQWKIVKYPEYSVGQEGSGQLAVTTTGYGEADVTGRQASDLGGPPVPFSASDLFSISGTVAVSGGTITFQPS